MLCTVKSCFHPRDVVAGRSIDDKAIDEFSRIINNQGMD
jgi:hypothetical protein